MKCPVCEEEVDVLVECQQFGECCELCKEYIDNEKALDEYYRNEEQRSYNEMKEGFDD